MFLILLRFRSCTMRWTLISVTIIALAVFCAAPRPSREDIRQPASRQPATHAHTPRSRHALHASTGYALYATLAPLWEWDFWAIWGLKARVFLEAGGIDWHFLESRWNAFAHPDYPLLVPLNFDFVALINGGWSDRWLGLLCRRLGRRAAADRARTRRARDHAILRVARSRWRWHRSPSSRVRRTGGRGAHRVRRRRRSLRARGPSRRR